MEKINTNNFDFLRVVFAFTVCFSHLIELSQVEMFQDYIGLFNTRLAINGFFVISGFLIVKSYENSKSLRSYFIKRVRRIIPAYLFVILLCALFFAVISTYSIGDYFLHRQFWKYLIANLTFQNYIEPCLPGVFSNNYLCVVNGALWTIKIEEAFYLLLPLFYWVTKSKKNKTHIFGVFVYLLSILYFNYFVSVDMYRIAKQLPGALAFFMCGIVLYKNFNFFIKWKHHIILPCLFVFFLEQYIFSIHIFKPLAYSFMVFYIAYNFKFLNHFGKYGDITYGVYIYHFPIIQVCVFYGLFQVYNPVFVSVFILLLVVILATLSWYLIELRFLSKGRKERQKKLLSS
ncbi:acyltransferase [Algibacter amylolyticus]|uniref:Acyltransferase n=1 Tax=Algibacter amylolyticus TaxID=1608400 RepID=A0A5M7BCW3_9FLAO|nr:acyltransferase [Algibacter amylolyticus]KAA5827289.1 acyltransferase [Algibacter amylolyticus]MBB5266471.1 peptidoglycan/LPS O-acetylase OafA/YrhL [Algibacter amylolyticus]TSJ81534.1 acyltransferase [Algibacter amylolyticus]